jgi:hypothetical protein
MRECGAACAQVLPAPAQPCWQALLPVLSRCVRCAPLLAPPESAGSHLAAPALLRLAVALFRRARTPQRGRAPSVMLPGAAPGRIHHRELQLICGAPMGAPVIDSDRNCIASLAL